MILLERFLQLILEFYYSITNSWGVSIIFLSVSVNLLLLPVYMLAEYLQNKERRARNAMQAKLEEIREVFHGSERFVMVGTLYRLHNYHPVMGLRSLASLLVQIPFFFAAYNMLKHYDAFAGVSFLFIPDLQTVDALIPIGRFAINLLPIIMTVVNIYAAQIYARRKDPDSLLSTWAMALLFLLLLYTAPAALVVYWTCNNIFSLIKNASLAYKQDSSMPSTVSIISEKISAWLSKDKVVIRTIALCWIVGGYWVLSYFLIPNIEKPGSQIANTLANMAGFVFTFTGIVLLLKYCIQNHTAKKRLAIASGISWILGVVLLAYYIFLPEYSVSLFTVLIKLIALIFLALPNIFFLPYFHGLVRGQGNTPIMPQRKHLWAVTTGIGVALVLIFYALPAQMYINAPDEVGLAYKSIALYNIVYILVIGIPLVLAYRFSPLNIRMITGFVLVWLSSLLLVYAIVVPFDIGQMNEFILMFPERIIPKFSIYIVEAGGILVLSIATYIFFKKKPGYIINIQVLLIIVLTIQILQSAAWRDKNVLAKTSDIPTQEESSGTPATAEKMLTFSKTGKNIVVLLLDMASGGYIPRILDEEPDFREKYEGFVWYPNTLSISTLTITSKPAMLGGWNYTPEEIVSLPGANLAQKVMRSYDTMFDTFQSHGYDVATSGVSYYGVDNLACDILQKRDVACLYFRDSSFVGYWLRNNNKVDISGSILDKDRLSLINMAGVLRSVPIVFKRLVYDKGHWNLKLPQYANQFAYQQALLEWSFIDSIATTSSLSDTAGNTFKFLHNNVTHTPYALDKNCELRFDVYPDEMENDNFSGNAAYYTELCTLKSIELWLDWLKEAGIYDNTKIIIVSDHGNYVNPNPMNVNGVTTNLFSGEKDYTFNSVHALLMIKEFNASGSMRDDMRLMSNVDTASIMYHSIENYQAPAHAHPWDMYDPTKVEPPVARELPVFRAEYYDWVDLVKENEFDIREKHRVKDNIFYQENWK